MGNPAEIQNCKYRYLLMKIPADPGLDFSYNLLDGSAGYLCINLQIQVITEPG
jgi:hypothetical protein